MTSIQEVVLQFKDINVKNEIKVKACESVSESYIAKEMNVSVHTVLRILNEPAESLKIKPLNELLEHMCRDEFSM